jgi:hypothetical protein
MAYKGIFTPRNPKKYNGDPTNIIWRSTWERRVMEWLDSHDQVIWWSSEELIIPYTSPIDNKKHRYFPDFVLKVKKSDGTEQVYVWEVKPEKQTVEPKRKRKTQKFIQESVVYAINQSKWRAADIFCKKNNWIFQVITEKHLF